MSERNYTRRIFKYKLDVERRQVVMMPKGAEVLRLGVQRGLPHIWVSVDESQPLEPYAFRGVTTGERYNEERLWYIGTVELDDWFVWHLFIIEQALPANPNDEEEVRWQADFDQIKRDIKAREDLSEEDTYESGELVPPHRKVPV
jgi:hypothetical protein